MPEPEPEPFTYDILTVDKLLSVTKGLINDLDESYRDIDDTVLKSALTVCLPEFSRSVPLRLLLDPAVTILAGAKTTEVPADFLAFDFDSFRDMLTGTSVSTDLVNYTDTTAFMSLTQAARPRDQRVFAPPDRMRFEVISSPAGGKLLYIKPVMQRPMTIDCLYWGLHKVDDELFTVPMEHRGSLCFKIAQFACLALKRQLWMDQQARSAYGQLAVSFKEMYDDAVTNIPIGFFG